MLFKSLKSITSSQSSSKFEVSSYFNINTQSSNSVSLLENGIGKNLLTNNNISLLNDNQNNSASLL